MPMQFSMGKVVLEFDGDRAKLDAALQAAGIGIKKVKAETESANKSVGTMTSGLKSMAGAIGVSFTAAAVVGFTKKVFDAASAINDQSKALGFSAEAFQRYSFAAKQGGGSQEAFVRSASVLNDKLAEGDKSTIAALEKIGLKYSDLRAMKPEQAFLAVANAVGKVEDPMLRVNVAQDLMGKGARELLPGMIEGYDKLGQAAKVMSDETVRRLEAAQDTWEAFFNTITIWSAEFLSKQLIFGGQMKDIPWLGRFFEDAPKAPDTWKGALDRFDVKGPNAAQLAALTGGVAMEVYVKRLKEAELQLSKLTPLQRQQLDAAKKLGEGFEGLANSYGLSTDAQKIYTAQSKDTSTALKDQAEAAKELVDWHDSMYGQDLIDRANQLAERLTEHIDVSSLSLKKQEEIFEVLDEGIAAYERMGRVAPEVLQKIYSKLIQITPDELRSVVDEVARLVNTVPVATFVVEDFGDFVKDAVDDVASQINGPARESFSDRLGPTILQALTGGGSVSRSIGGLAGQRIGESLTRRFGDAIKSKLPGALGGALSAMLPGIGALIGAGLGAAISGIGRLFGFGPSELEKVRAARAEWLKAQGGLDKLHKSLGAVAGDPKVRAAFNDLFNARRLKDYEAALERFNATVAETQEAINKRLGDEQEARDFLQQTLDKYNVSLDDMGEKWRQQSVTDQAALLVREYTAMTASGMGHNRVLQIMGRNLNEFFLTALKTGAEVPKQLEPLLRQMIDEGVLLDENGEKFDLQALDSIHWSETLTQNIQKVVDKLDELIRTITDKLGKAIEEVPALEIPVDLTPDKAFGRRQRAGVPSFAGQAHVLRPTMAIVGDVPGGEFVLHRSTLDDVVRRAVTAGAASGPADSAAVLNELRSLGVKLDRIAESRGVVLLESEPVGRIVGRTKGAQEELSRAIRHNHNDLGSAVIVAASKA